MTHKLSGFTLIEMMLVVAIAGITAAFAVPSWQQMQADSRAKTAARVIANAFQYARTQAIVSENVHVVYFNMGAGTDACGNALPGPIVILDDGPPAAGNNCCIDVGETVITLPNDPQREFLNLNWGVSFAVAPPISDTGGGAMATGSTFTDPFGLQTRWVSFRPDGIPVGFSAACVAGQVGTGRGAVYLTNAAGPRGARDYAVVLSPLGTAKVHGFDNSTGAWTN